MFFLAAEEVDQSMVIAIACVFSFVGIAGGVFVNNYIAKLKHGAASRSAKKIIGDAPVITCRPADNLAPELDELRAKIAQYIEQDEDVLSYALFEQVAIKFFEYRKAKKYALDAENSDASIGVHAV